MKKSTEIKEIENYPGFSKTSGKEIASSLVRQLRELDINVTKGNVQTILKSENGFDVVCDTLKVSANKVILATGGGKINSSILGEEKYVGSGVSYCATCDGNFFKGLDVAVVGNNSDTIEEAIYLTKFASKVYIIHRRDELRADKIIQQRAFKNPQIEIVYDTIPLEIIGENTVTSIVVKNVKTNQIKEIKTNGVFPYIGFSSNSELFTDKLEKDENGLMTLLPYFPLSLPLEQLLRLFQLKILFLLHSFVKKQSFLFSLSLQQDYAPTAPPFFQGE